MSVHTILKSNMDRFIAVYTMVVAILGCVLKSNMDRFIDTLSDYADMAIKILKSNMDRFIASIQCFPSERSSAFKIQYG